MKPWHARANARRSALRRARRVLLSRDTSPEEKERAVEQLRLHVEGPNAWRSLEACKALLDSDYLRDWIPPGRSPHRSVPTSDAPAGGRTFDHEVPRARRIATCRTEPCVGDQLLLRSAVSVGQLANSRRASCRDLAGRRRVASRQENDVLVQRYTSGEGVRLVGTAPTDLYPSTMPTGAPRSSKARIVA